MLSRHFRICLVAFVVSLLTACSSGGTNTNAGLPNNSAIRGAATSAFAGVGCQTITDSTGTVYTAARVGGGNDLDIEYSANPTPCQIGVYIGRNYGESSLNHTVINGPFNIGLYIDGVGEMRQNHTSICANGEQADGMTCASGPNRSAGTGEEIRGTQILNGEQLNIDGYSAGFATQPCPNSSQHLKVVHGTVTDSNYPWSYQGGDNNFNHDNPPFDPNSANACAGSAVGAGLSSAVLSVTGTIVPPPLKLASADGRTVVGIQFGKLTAPNGTVHLTVTLRSPPPGSYTASINMKPLSSINGAEKSLPSPIIAEQSNNKAISHSLATVPPDVCAPFWIYNGNPTIEIANWLCVATDGDISFYTDFAIFTVDPPFDYLPPYYYCSNNYGQDNSVSCQVTKTVDTSPSGLYPIVTPESIGTLPGTVTFFLPGFVNGGDAHSLTTVLSFDHPALFAIGAVPSNARYVVHQGQSVNLYWINLGACAGGCTWYADGLPQGIAASFSPRVTFGPPNAVAETISAASNATLGQYQVGTYVIDGSGRASGSTNITLVVQP